MGTYGSIASGIKECGSSIKSDCSSVGTSFSFGNDDTFESLISKLNSVKNEISNQCSSLNDFAAILVKVDEYIELEKAISTLENNIASWNSQLSGLKSDDPSVSRLKSKISTANSDKRNKESQKQRIKSEVNSYHVSSVGKEYEIIEAATPEDLSDLSFDIDELLSKFRSGNLVKMGDGDSLYNYYNKSDVVNYMNEIKKEYSGRKAAVYSALAMIDLAAKAGGKLDYDWGGGHNGSYTTLDDVAAGTDCSAFASWAVNQGASSGFATQATGGLISSGSSEDLASAKPGDLLVRHSGNNGHVYFVVENNTKAGEFIVAEANSSSVGVQLSTHAYSELSGIYNARDMSAVYGE